VPIGREAAAKHEESRAGPTWREIARLRRGDETGFADATTTLAPPRSQWRKQLRGRSLGASSAKRSMRHVSMSAALIPCEVAPRL
jgi:hypothetical protein